MTIYPFHWLIADGSGTSILVFGGWWDAIAVDSTSSGSVSRHQVAVGVSFAIGF